MDQISRPPRPNVLYSLKFIALLLSGALAASAAILPDGMGKWKKVASTDTTVPDAKVWQEYGLQDSETTEFSNGAGKLVISAFRFGDATGALAGFELIRPADSHNCALSKLCAANGTDTVAAAGNYVFVFKNYQPKPEELNYLVGVVPRYRQTPLPSFIQFVPARGMQPSSERYILGPESLARFAPSIPSGTAAFHFGAEAQLANYGKSTLLVFNYPAMEMARDRFVQFQKLPDTTVKRSGPLVAIVLHPASSDEAERLLSQVKYQAEVTVTEHVPTRKDNPVDLFLNIAKLVGVLAGFCLLSGLAMGGLRLLFRRGGASGEGEPMISLHLSGRD